MVCGTFTESKVPHESLDQRIAVWKGTKPPPMIVASKADGEGTFTITAVFPPCGDNTTHSTKGSV
jgi:hypothetical protein